MASEPSPQRRPLDERPPLQNRRARPSLESSVERSLDPMPRQPTLRHIPRFFVLLSESEEGGTSNTTGAHRFPVQPTPVLGAAIALLGFPSLDVACRPWQRRRAGYRCAQIKGDGSGRMHTFSSTRFPKV